MRASEIGCCKGGRYDRGDRFDRAQPRTAALIDTIEDN